MRLFSSAIRPRSNPCLAHSRLRLEVLEDRAVPAAINYATDFADNVYATAMNSTGDLYMTGLGFVAELNPTGTGVIYNVSIGSAMRGTGIAVNSSGDAYVIGTATGVPTTSNAIASSGSEFVAELSPTGSILYATYLPGAYDSIVSIYGQSGAIAVYDGNIYAAGAAESGLPVTASAFQKKDDSTINAFFAEIDPALSGNASLLYATYLGGSGQDAATAIAVDGSGNAYLTGYTTSTNFPTTKGAFQTTNTAGSGKFDAFVAKINPAASGSASLVYSTYLGGSGSQGYVSDGTALFDARTDGGIAVNSAGDAYVTGSTTSSNFPTTTGAFQTSAGFTGNGSYDGSPSDAFLTELNATGTGLVYSTYLGGGNSSRSGATAVVLDSAGDAYLTGWTNSTTFPTVNSVQATGPATNGGSAYGAFVTEVSPTGSSLVFSSYIGGNPSGSARVEGMGIALDAEGDIYVGGITGSYSSFPTTPGAYQTSGGNGFALEITGANP